MKKYLNGVLVDLSEQEITEVNESKAAWDATAGERLVQQIRAIRAPLLIEADIQINKHVDSDNANLGAWRTYRQALRDITNTEDLSNIVWPVKPATLP